MNMKKLLFLLLLSCLIAPANAQITTNVERAARHAQQTAPSLPSLTSPQQKRERQRQILEALKAEVWRLPTKQNWAYFLEQTQQIQQRLKEEEARANQYACHLYDTDCRLFTKELGTWSWGDFRPNYAKETKGIKYIYVSDASDHDTKTIPAEVSRVMQEVRRANPNARILLATEFAVDKWEDRSLPLRFAHSKKMPFEINPSYEPLLLAGDQNDIDILGLDDNGRAMDEQTIKIGDTSIKIGDTSIEISLEDPQIQRILSQYESQVKEYPEAKGLLRQYSDSYQYCQEHPQEAIQRLGISPEELPQYMDAYINESYKLYEYCESVSATILHDFLSRSNWGALQRNRQWTRYIQAVSPFYDIIITYAGSGHLSSGDSQDLPELIGEEFVIFDFYAQERLPEKLEQFYDQVNKIQQQEKTYSVPLQENLRADVANEFLQQMETALQLGYIQPPQGADMGHVFFVKNSYKGLSEEDRKEFREVRNQFSVPPSKKLVDFAVYLLEENTPQ